LKFFEKIEKARVEIDAKTNSETLLYIYNYSTLFRAIFIAFCFQVCKKCEYDYKNIFSKKMIWVARDADFQI